MAPEFKTFFVVCLVVYGGGYAAFKVCGLLKVCRLLKEDDAMVWLGCTTVFARLLWKYLLPPA